MEAATDSTTTVDIATGAHAGGAESAGTRNPVDTLAEDGYCVVPGFLPPDVVERVLEDYRSHGASDNTNYQIGIASPQAIDIVRPLIAAMAEEVGTRTGVRTSFEGLHQAYYFDTQVLTFGKWHQDAESHYMLGTHANYLNFYIPILKEDRKKTNLQVIPASALRARAPEAWALIKDGGGTLCHDSGSGGTVVFDETGERLSLPFPIGELAVTPELAPGDLLLLRGDTFHRTQDGSTSRVALSLRLADPDLVISLDDLAVGSSKKVSLMAGNWSEFGPVFDCLSDAPDGRATWREIRKKIAESAAASRPVASRWAARRRILSEKLRRGTVIDSLRREFSYRKTRRQLGI